MLRITKIAEDGSTISMKAEGQIVSDWVAVLETECKTALRSGKHVTVDLSDVTFVECRAARMLRLFRLEGLEIVRCPKLINSLIDSLDPCDDE